MPWKIMEGGFDAFVGGMVSMTFGHAPPKWLGLLLAEARKRHTASFRHCRGLRSSLRQEEKSP